MRVAHQEQSTINSELHTKMRVAHQDQGAIHSELNTEMRLAHQDESAFRSVWKMAKFEEIFPDKIGIVRTVEVLVNPNKDVSNKSKNVDDDSDNENNEDEDGENVKNDDEVKVKFTIMMMYATPCRFLLQFS